MARRRNNKQPATGFANRKAEILHKVVVLNSPSGRQDIKNWQTALTAAQSVDMPRPYRLYQLYDNVLIDAVLGDKMDLRILDVLGEKANFLINNEIDEELTKSITESKWFEQLSRKVLEAIFYKFSVVELSFSNGKLVVDNIPRTNIVHKTGRVLFDVMSDVGINYREMPEYGTSILEFTYDNDNAPFGLLNKLVPHVLIKRFAFGCWSEYGEVAGIPFRTLKTNTDNESSLNRLQTMMQTMGSSPWAVIDDTETIEWANNHSSHNGEVFNHLIQACDGQIALGIRGAIVGQDTQYGNYSAEAAGIEVASKITDADKKMLTSAWNDTIIPALVKLGIIPEGASFAFQEAADIDALWGRVKDVLPYKDVDDQWINDTFGIPVSTKVSNATSQNLSASSFFD